MLISPMTEGWNWERSEPVDPPLESIRCGQVIKLLLKVIEARDNGSSLHLMRTARRAADLAEVLGWPSHLLGELRQSASLHDIGKIATPRAVLRKQGRLTPAEFDIVKSHTLIGASILHRVAHPVFQLASEIALYHHERWDGEGYPHGLEGLNIPFGARIVAVVDVFDALIEDRVYRPALSPEEALDLMQLERARQFDPEILDSFMELAQREAWCESAATGAMSQPAGEVATALRLVPRRRRPKRRVVAGWTTVKPSYSPA